MRIITFFRKFDGQPSPDGITSYRGAVNSPADYKDIDAVIHARFLMLPIKGQRAAAQAFKISWH